MDDDFQTLEQELRQLRPAPVPAQLEERVGRELAECNTADSRGGAVVRRWWWAVALPVAAAVAVIWTLKSPSAIPSAGTGAANVAALASAPDEGGLKPVAAENVLIAARDEGVVTLDDGTAARRERLQFVDTITWKNPRTNASLRWSIPREEVRVVPIVFQ